MLERLDRLYVRANRALVGGLMIAMFALVFTNVVTRYGFGFSLSWSEEIARFLMIWVTFLGAGLALREGRHVAIELLQDLLPEAQRRLLRTALAALILIFLGVLVMAVRHGVEVRSVRASPGASSALKSSGSHTRHEHWSATRADMKAFSTMHTLVS